MANGRKDAVWLDYPTEEIRLTKLPSRRMKFSGIVLKKVLENEVPNGPPFGMSYRSSNREEGDRRFLLKAMHIFQECLVSQMPVQQQGRSFQ